MENLNITKARTRQATLVRTQNSDKTLVQLKQLIKRILQTSHNTRGNICGRALNHHKILLFCATFCLFGQKLFLLSPAINIYCHQYVEKTFSFQKMVNQFLEVSGKVHCSIWKSNTYYHFWQFKHTLLFIRNWSIRNYYSATQKVKKVQYWTLRQKFFGVYVFKV